MVVSILVGLSVCRWVSKWVGGYYGVTDNFGGSCGVYAGTFDECMRLLWIVLLFYFLSFHMILGYTIVFYHVMYLMSKV